MELTTPYPNSHQKNADESFAQWDQLSEMFYFFLWSLRMVWAWTKQKVCRCWKSLEAKNCFQYTYASDDFTLRPNWILIIKYFHLASLKEGTTAEGKKMLARISNRIRILFSISYASLEVAELINFSSQKKWFFYVFLLV